MNAVVLKSDWDIFQHELRSFVFAKVRDKALADDIVHDVFLKVYDKLDQLRNSEKLLAWIYQITRNTITDHFRKKNKIISPENVNWANDPNDLNECVAICLNQLLKTLPDKYRQALELSEMENLSQVELAKRLGITYSGAKSRVQRARQMLKEKMEAVLIVKTDSYGNVIVCEDRGPCDC